MVFQDPKEDKNSPTGHPDQEHGTGKKRNALSTTQGISNISRGTCDPPTPQWAIEPDFLPGVIGHRFWGMP